MVVEVDAGVETTDTEGAEEQEEVKEERRDIENQPIPKECLLKVKLRR